MWYLFVVYGWLASLAVLIHTLPSSSTEVGVCSGCFGIISKANRPAYLHTEECGLSVRFAFLSEQEN